MKKIAIFSFLAFFTMALAIAAPVPAFAQEEDDGPKVGVKGYPDISSNLDVATLYHRLIGVLPDFEKWLRFMPEYTKLPLDEQVDYMEKKPRELLDTFRLMSPEQPVIAQFKGSLSRYSDESGGYVVRNFEETTFFQYSFAGRNYAVIPQGLMEHQFLDVTGLPQKDVEAVLKANKRNIRVVIFLTPNFAGKDDKPIEMADPDDGKMKTYTLVSGKVANIALYSCPKNKSCTALWQTGTKEFRDDEKNELLNLKQ